MIKKELSWSKKRMGEGSTITSPSYHAKSNRGIRARIVDIIRTSFSNIGASSFEDGGDNILEGCRKKERRKT